MLKANQFGLHQELVDTMHPKDGEFLIFTRKMEEILIPRRVKSADMASDSVSILHST
jgi:hypothetical protein